MNSFHQKNFQYLKNAYSADNLHHSYIFYGPMGAGKFEFAAHFARFLQCENNKKEIPCEECKNCKVSKNDFIVNTYILNKEKDESVTINDIRELQKKEGLSATDGSWKIFIINSAQNLTREASEALLKTLEEPSRKSLIILITEEKKQLSKTMLSRCPAVFFPKKDKEDLNQLGDDKYIEKVLDQLRILLGDKVFEKMILAKEIVEEKDISQKVQDWLMVLYILFTIKNDCPDISLVNIKKLESLEKALDYDRMAGVLEKTYNLLNLLDTNVSKRVLFEDFVLSIGD